MKVAMRAQSIRLASLSLVVVVCACNSVEPQLLASWAQWEERAFVVGAGRSVLVLVVDDSASTDSEELRDQVGEALRVSLRRLDEYARFVDPAAWRPVSWKVVMVLPSARGSERFVGPLDVPAFDHELRFSTQDTTDALADAVSAELAVRVAPSGASYRPLEAATDALELLLELRVPVDDREAQLVDVTKGERRALLLAVASAREDESPQPVSYYALPPRSDDWYGVVTAIVPSSDQDPCWLQQQDHDPSSRISTWAHDAALGDWSGAVYGWPCSSGMLAATGLLALGWVDGSGRNWCTSYPIEVAPSGQAECLITVEKRSSDPCDVERGWLDPRDEDGIRRPTEAEDRHGSYRICEVAQLEGSKLDACRTTRACDGCGSGWCRSNSPEVIEGIDWCTAGSLPSGLRFVGGAMAAADAQFRIVCNLAR
jgi:hypothetical protein